MGENSHFKLSVHIPAPFTVPIWYYTTQNNDVTTLPGRFIFQPYVAKDYLVPSGKKKKNLINERRGFVVCVCGIDALKKIKKKRKRHG